MQPPLSFLTTLQPSMNTTHIISHKEQYIGSHNSLTCLLANTKMVASLSSSSPSMRISSSLASPIRSRSLLSTTKIKPTRQREFTIVAEQKTSQTTPPRCCDGHPNLVYSPTTTHVQPWLHPPKQKSGPMVYVHVTHYMSCKASNVYRMHSHIQHYSAILRF